MPTVPLVLAGHVYTHDTQTPISGIVVSCRNLTTGEEHNGSEGVYPELTTNVNGEFLVNLANFDNTYSSGDRVRFTLIHNGLEDEIYITITNASVSTLVMTPLIEEVFDYERCLDDLGSIVTIFNEVRTLDDDYGSIDLETVSEHPNKDDTFASIQIEEDELSQERQGVVPHGKAKGFFKVRYNVKKDDTVEVPKDSGDKWKVMDRPVSHWISNVLSHHEANLERIE